MIQMENPDDRFGFNVELFFVSKSPTLQNDQFHLRLGRTVDDRP
jgi:hypothetical protein